MDRAEIVAVAAFVAASGANETFDVLTDRFPYTPVCSYSATDPGLISSLANTLHVLLGLNVASVTLQWPDGEKVIVTDDCVSGLPPLKPGDHVIEAQTMSASDAVRFVRKLVLLIEGMSFANGEGMNLWVKFECDAANKAIVDFPITAAAAAVAEGAALMALGGVETTLGVEYSGVFLSLKMNAGNKSLVTIAGTVELSDL